jgi:hypothetical protein
MLCRLWHELDRTASMQEILINVFSDADQRGVLNVILPIQQREFGIPVTAADQPDQISIPEFYQSGTGGWVARSDGEVVGTVGLKDIGLGQAALRKMFVAAPFRGREFGVASRLFDVLLATRARGELPKFFSAPRTNFWRRIASMKREASRSCNKPICPGHFRSWPSIRNSMP